MKIQDQTGTKTRVTLSLEESHVKTADRVAAAMDVSRSMFFGILLESVDLNALIQQYENSKKS